MNSILQNPYIFPVFQTGSTIKKRLAIPRQLKKLLFLIQEMYSWPTIYLSKSKVTHNFKKNTIDMHIL